MKSDVSVVIPTYNGAKFIHRALESVFEQTRPAREIVVVDDGSKDRTREVVSRVQASAPVPVRLIELTRNSGGPGRPLNVGVEAAQSDLILALEQDDTMRPRRIEQQECAIRKFPEGTLVTGRFCVRGNADGDMRPIWPVSQFSGVVDDIEAEGLLVVLEARRAFRELLRRQFSGGISCYAFTKRTWKQLGGFSERVHVCVDLDFAFKALLAGRIVAVNHVIMDYEWRADSLWRRDLERSSVESTVVQLAYASRMREWAAEERERLEITALGLLRAALRRREWSVAATLLPTILAHVRLGRAVGRKLYRRKTSPR